LDGKQQAVAKARERFKITWHLKQQKRRLYESGEQLARVVLAKNRSVTTGTRTVYQEKKSVGIKQ